MILNVLLDLAKADGSGMGLTAFVLLPLLFSIFPHFSYSVSVCFIPVREGNDYFSTTWKLDWAQEKMEIIEWRWCLLQSFPPSLPSLFTSSQPWGFPQHPGIPLWEEGGSRLLCPRFCASLSCILFPSACDNVEEFPSQPFPGIPCVPWREGRKPIRLYEADNRRCF